MKLKDILNQLKLKKELEQHTLNSSSSHDNLVVTNANDAANIAKQQDAPMITRQNVLVNEFIGDPPVVYSSHFGTRIVGPDRDESNEKSNAYQVRKQDQYGYKGSDATETEKDEWDSVDDTVVFTTKGKGISLATPKSDIANFLNEEQEFDERWNRIKDEVEEIGEDDIKIIE